jgi:hypothetical protein
MSFPRHREIFPFDQPQAESSDGSVGLAANAPAHRLDEFPAGYSSAGCSPASPASASPTGYEYAVMSSCRSRTFHRTVNCVLTVCVTRGGTFTIPFIPLICGPNISEKFPLPTHHLLCLLYHSTNTAPNRIRPSRCLRSNQHPRMRLPREGLSFRNIKSVPHLLHMQLAYDVSQTRQHAREIDVKRYVPALCGSARRLVSSLTSPSREEATPTFRRGAPKPECRTRRRPLRHPHEHPTNSSPKSARLIAKRQA